MWLDFKCSWQVVHRAMLHANNTRQALQSKEERAPPVLVACIKPDIDWAKLNTDGSALACPGLAAVMCDEPGNVKWAVAQPI